MVEWCCNGMSDVLLFMKSYIIKNADFLGKNWCLAFSALFDVSNVVWPCFTCLYLRKYNHYWLKISQKTIPFLFIVKAFFLKQNSVLLLLLLIFVSLAVFTVALFTGVFIELAYDALALWKKKRIRTSCNLFFLFFFCFVCFKCYCFCLHWIKALFSKQSQTAFYRFLSFFLRILRFILK